MSGRWLRPGRTRCKTGFRRCGSSGATAFGISRIPATPSSCRILRITPFPCGKHFIEKGFNRLAIGGKMVMVTKRRDWYKRKLIAIFGGVQIREVDGYYVFLSEKRSAVYAGK